MFVLVHKSEYDIVWLAFDELNNFRVFLINTKDSDEDQTVEDKENSKSILSITIDGEIQANQKKRIAMTIGVWLDSVEN